MAQIRVMGDDADDVTAVLERLLPLVRASTALVAGPTTELSMRGPGRRVVFELLPAPADRTVRVERTDTAAPRRRSAALPPRSS